MTEEYEYERVEIKPGDQSWQGQEIFYADDKTMLLVLFVGEQNIFYRIIRDGGFCEDTISIDLPFKNHEFYIRKPKRKMLKKALFVLKTAGTFHPVEYYPNDEFLTEDEAKQLHGENLFKWPYGEIIEVPEGE